MTQPAAIVMTVGGRSMPLERGAALDASRLGIGPAHVIVGRVDPHPRDASQLVLINLSDRSWSVSAPDGEQRAIKPQQSVRVEAGRQIDFGGVIGVLSASGGDFVPIEKDTIEKLARKLHRAASEGVLDQKEFDRLHAGFYAVDEQGVPWTVGLKTREWNRVDSGRWVPAAPPSGDLVIERSAFDQLAGLEQRLARAK